METRTGQCHCGAVTFEVALLNGLNDLIRCNCSICRKKNALMVAVPKENLSITQGADKLTVYQWNTMTAKHFFCRICGIYTHHYRRRDPSQAGINVACLDGVDIHTITDAPIFDGASLSTV